MAAEAIALPGGSGATMPPRRRADDSTLSLLLAGPAASGARKSLVLREYMLGAGPAVRPLPQPARDAAPGESAVLLDLGEEEALLVAGATLGRLPRGDGGPDLLARAAAGATAWGRERARDRRRLRLAEQLIRFTEQLNSATARADVHEALLSNVVSIVGAYTAMLCVGDEDGSPLRVVGGPRCPAGAEALCVGWRPELGRSGVFWVGSERPGPGTPLFELGGVLVDIGARTVVRVPAWGRTVLVLVERRENRVFEASDWELLRTLVRQAEVAAERVRLFEEVSALSLTDPLTGLGNRRRMEVVLKHGVAAAQRGGLLSMVMLDIDDFKEINDRDGHPAGDAVLRLVADTLREHLRGSDVAVRYGGDEFLLVLPDTCAAGAEALVERIRAHLPGGVRVSAGATEYDPSIQSPEELIAAADRELYRDKRQRRGGR
jgi:diguanylate cyclase (GGDEF)-like protein